MNIPLAIINGSESIVAVLAGAITTTNPIYSVVWEGDGGPANPMGAMTGTTEKTLLESSNTPRKVMSVRFYNADSANITVTLYKKVSGTNYQIDKATLSPGTSITFSVSPAGPQGEEGAAGDTGPAGADGADGMG